MLLALDMGNTNITIGVFDDKKLIMESRLSTDYTKMQDQYAIELISICRLNGVNPADIDGAIFSSVVPPLESTIKYAVKKMTGITPIAVGPGIKTGINIRIDNPAQLGADLLVGAVAAADKYPLPCIIWDLGTATTVSVVDENNVFLGGAIIPGVNTAIESLSSRTSLLPRIRMEAPAHAIGKNTIESMQSGAVLGTASTIDGMCERYENELGGKATIIATGGLGRDIIPHCKYDIVYDEHLLLDGLRIIYEKNRS